MLNRVSGAKLSRDIEKEERIEVMAFPGATMNCLRHHIQPSIPKKPDRFMIHCGTNNLNSEDRPEKIANDIIQLGKAVKMQKRMLLFLGFVHAEIVLIKRQMKWTNYWLENVLRTVLILYLIVILIQGCILKEMIST